jgi:hypothetical protein
MFYLVANQLLKRYFTVLRTALTLAISAILIDSSDAGDLEQCNLRSTNRFILLSGHIGSQHPKGSSSSQLVPLPTWLFLKSRTKVLSFAQQYSFSPGIECMNPRILVCGGSRRRSKPPVLVSRLKSLLWVAATTNSTTKVY